MRKILFFVALGSFTSFVGLFADEKKPNIIREADSVGYRVIVEGGEEGRQERRFDADGTAREIFSVKGNQKDATVLDESLLGGGLKLDNFSVESTPEQSIVPKKIQEEKAPRNNIGRLENVLKKTSYKNPTPASFKDNKKVVVKSEKVIDKREVGNSKNVRSIVNQAEEKGLLNPNAQTEDGTNLPFFVSGGGISGNRPIKNYMKMNENFSHNEAFLSRNELERNEAFTGMATFKTTENVQIFGLNERFNEERHIWENERFEGAVVKDIEQTDRYNRSWEKNKKVSLKNPNERLQKISEKISKEKKSRFSEAEIRMMFIGNEVSMQDINRYQFRRNHSSDPGVKKIPIETK